jgi:ElaA protein
MNQMQWVIKPFQKLSLAELYEILQLRNKVFIVEQNCPYQDVDGKDQSALHLMGWKDDFLVAYARVYSSETDHGMMHIGRVLTHVDYRQCGYGRTLMQKCIEHCFSQTGVERIQISAQTYLIAFLFFFGFYRLWRSVSRR